MATKFKQPLTKPPSAVIAAAQQNTKAAASGSNKTASAQDHKQRLDAARAAMAASSLAVKNPVPASTLPQRNSTVLALPVDEIEPYEKNPRVAKNDMFEDIKESIRATKGLDGIIQVMRQPGVGHYVCAKGANTRLLAIKELWEETRDADFEQVLAQIVPWKGHAAAIADHVKENTLRGDMTYWDRAKACAAIWDEAKAEGNEFAGIKAFAKVLKEDLGYPIDVPTLSRYMHCARHFQAIGDYLNNITAKDTVPASNMLVRLAMKWGHDEAQAWEDLEAALARYAERLHKGDEAFNTDACVQYLYDSTASNLGLTAYQLEFAVSALKADTRDQSTKDDLMTTPEPLAALGPVSSNDDGEEEPDLDLLSLGDPASLGDGTGTQASLGVSAPASFEVGAAQCISSAPTVPRYVIDFDTAMERVIDAASAFADVCDIGEHICTGREFPYGFYVEIKALTEVFKECAYMLVSDGEFESKHVRQGAFWLLVTLSQQWTQPVNQLLPAGRWRKLWAEETRETFMPDTLNGLTGGHLGPDWEAMVPVQILYAVFEAPKRASAYAQLCGAVASLRALRNTREQRQQGQ